MQVLDAPTEYNNLETKYIVSLSDCRIGSDATARIRKHSVIFVGGKSPVVTTQVTTHVYCNIDKCIKEVIFWADDRFRYAYKNEEKLLSYLAK